MPSPTTMTTTKGTSIFQEEFHVPDIPLKELREVIPYALYFLYFESHQN